MTNIMKADGSEVCLIVGAGPGTGAALARRFAAGGCRVAMAARDAGRLAALEAEIPGARGFPADATDPASLAAMLARVRAELGEPLTVVHNAVRGTFGGFLEVDPAELELNFRANVLSLLHLARAVAPAMIEAGRGALLVTGNTSALRGRPNFAAFAPSKAAQRSLAQAIAREIGPRGVHVAYFVIDAVIDSQRMRARSPGKPDDFFIQPAAIAEEVWRVARQPRSAWSFEVELRPYAEVW
jgi:NAD(P)-dependent dehydrogenase (short-subunit alcohol dehydrogenase family)